MTHPSDTSAQQATHVPVPSRQVLRQFRVIFNAIKTHFSQVEHESGLGGAQVWALSVVAESPGIGVGQMAHAMDIRQPTASNLVRGLVSKGLMRSERSGSDRRAVALFVTDEALSILSRVPGPWAGVLPHALDALDEATLQRLQSDLAQVIRGLAVPDAVEAADAATTPLAQL